MPRETNLPPEIREKGGPGRPKGSLNKVTRCMKAQTWRVFEALEADPTTSLETIAKNNPAWFHSVFSGRIIPKDITVRTIQSIDDLTAEEQTALLEDLRKRLAE